MPVDPASVHGLGLVGLDREGLGCDVGVEHVGDGLRLAPLALLCQRIAAVMDGAAQRLGLGARLVGRELAMLADRGAAGAALGRPVLVDVGLDAAGQHQEAEALDLGVPDVEAPGRIGRRRVHHPLRYFRHRRPPCQHHVSTER